MIHDFLKELPRIETSELGNDSRCMIYQREYGLEHSDADTIEEAEEAVRLPCGHLAGRVGSARRGLASVLETADPKGVIYIQLRDSGGATIHQVDTHTYSDRPNQDEVIFRSIVLRGALDGPPLIKEGRQGSWWTYLGDGDDFSTHDLDFWGGTGDQETDFDSESDLDLHEGIDDPDKGGGNGAEAHAAFGRGSDNEEDEIKL